MGSPWLTASVDRGTRWTASPVAVADEVARIKQIEFFSYEGHTVQNGKLTVIGVLSHERPYSGAESLRVRLEYPDDFPGTEPAVYDHDKIFEPTEAGHQFPDYGLCLRFPGREAFAKDIALLGREVLGAALNWLVKRGIFERSGRKNWPGEAEQHGWARPYADLAREQAAQVPGMFLSVWVAWALSSLEYPRLRADCPCLSGKHLGQCHKDLAKLVFRAISHAKLEAPEIQRKLGQGERAYEAEIRGRSGPSSSYRNGKRSKNRQWR